MLLVRAPSMPQPDGEDRVVVIGAGLAGLSTARALADAGRSVVVLERARGVGGRCATRRIEGGQAVDHGLAFLHGREPEFLAALAEVPGARLPGWPLEVHGGGRPCQPEAFAEDEQRLAFLEGVAVFPRHLARDLDVRAASRVTAVEVVDDAIRVTIDDAPPLVARTVVLALAIEQSLSVLASIGAASPGLDTAVALLSMLRSQPCLTVIAAYPKDVPGPAWHVSYPEDSRVLQLISHDSSKRHDPAHTVMVYQAHPRWSRAYLVEDAAATEVWSRELLVEAARLLGAWAATPCFLQAHRWRHARTDRGAEFCAPLLLHLPSSAAAGLRLGLAGEVFFPGGGACAAWMSGVRLARMILAEENR